jgi:hypothetical protein
MAFIKGMSGNPSGRPKGSRNKASEHLRGLIADFLEEKFDQVVQDFADLDPKDRIRFYCDMLQYSVPKLQSVGSSVDFENLSDQELDQIIEELKRTA